jgi:RNA polymerase sigma-32 factor
MSTATLTVTERDLVLGGPLGSLDQYIHAVASVPVLSATEEFDLATKYREHEDLDAARRLVLAHLRFVVHIARGYAGYGLQLGDLIQEGNIGLMKAVKRFDPEVGVRLVSFAVHWIRAEIHEFVLKNWRLVKVATTKAQRKLFFNLRKAKKHLGWLTKDETEAVAQDLGVTAREVTEMEQRLQGRDLSFDLDPDDEDSHSPVAYLPSPGSDPAELIEASDWQEQSSARLAEAFEDLDARSRDILERRWMAETKSTLHELAADHGVSAERIRQIENSAIKKLKSYLTTAA